MAESTPQTARGRNWLMRQFSNPVFGIVASLASVLGLILTIYFYIQSTKKRDLVYFVNPAQAVVVKTGEASNLHVFYGSGELKSDVTAAQVAIWNQGNDSIRPENILEQAVIRTDPSVPILEASVRKRSRNVVDVSLDQSRLGEGSLGVKWNILEQNDGAVIQIVYAGPPTTGIRATGVIEGQKQIRELKDPQSARAFFAGGTPKWLPLWLVGSVAIGVGSFFLVYAVTNLRRTWGSGSRALSLLRVSEAAIAVCMIGLGVLQLIFLAPPNPPFGF
jgi:hypothetical protein